MFQHDLVLESEIDERAEIGRVEGGKAEYEQKHADGPYSEMLFLGEIRIEYRVLQFFPKGEQNDEREDQCHGQRNVEMRTLDGYN